MDLVVQNTDQNKHISSSSWNSPKFRLLSVFLDIAVEVECAAFCSQRNWCWPVFTECEMKACSFILNDMLEIWGDGHCPLSCVLMQACFSLSGYIATVISVTVDSCRPVILTALVVIATIISVTVDSCRPVTLTTLVVIATIISVTVDSCRHVTVLVVIAVIICVTVDSCRPVTVLVVIATVINVIVDSCRPVTLTALVVIAVTICVTVESPSKARCTITMGVAVFLPLHWIRIQKISI